MLRTRKAHHAALSIPLTEAQEVPDLQFVSPGGHTGEQQAERVEDDQAEEPGLRPVYLLWTHVGHSSTSTPSGARPQVSRVSGESVTPHS
ncbi:hypothetical protein D623_10020919 [Myotis brandtii]|uniref:Uncharacterized protein n=1 Tax=Myotis brandtii TaxID=109478 RepID=S7MVE2_MYOBR|nr:hypothetical protein D623_10020919 [Myotis brandtii]